MSMRTAATTRAPTRGRAARRRPAAGIDRLRREDGPLRISILLGRREPRPDHRISRSARFITALMLTPISRRRLAALELRQLPIDEMLVLQQP